MNSVDFDWRYILCVALLIAAVVFAFASAHADTYTFEGLTGLGAVTGSFNVDLSAPIAVNVRGWSNAVYAVNSWNFTALSNPALLVFSGIDPALLPTTTFTPALGSFEYCVGLCTFSAAANTALTMTDGTYRLKLSFAPELRTNGSWYERINGPVSLVTSGTLTQQSVPLPGTFWSTLIGLAGIFVYTFRK